MLCMLEGTDGRANASGPVDHQSRRSQMRVVTPVKRVKAFDTTYSLRVTDCSLITVQKRFQGTSTQASTTVCPSPHIASVYKCRVA